VAHSLGASRVLLHSISEAAATEVSSKCRELCPLVASRTLVIGVGHSFYLTVASSIIDSKSVVPVHWHVGTRERDIVGAIYVTQCVNPEQSIANDPNYFDDDPTWLT